MDEERLLGESNPFLEVIEQVSRLAPIARPVLIIGERGTGKELIAHRLHYLSPRWQHPFIKLNCAALNESLLDSELFGHEAGAFTGAQRRHPGRFERAHGGTLLLDELATMSDRLQEKLLRVIEYGEFERVGGQQPVQVDVRLICATHADLPALARAGKFRHDLLDRMAFDVITLPPLRVRQGDIVLLAHHFAQQWAQELGWPQAPTFDQAVLTQLCQHPWPGNVRELRNVVERSLFRYGEPGVPLSRLCLDPFASTWQMPTAEPATAGVSWPLDWKQHLAEYETALLRQALLRSDFNQRQAAQSLGLSYHQLRGLLRKYPGLLHRQVETDTDRE
ncbi:phage shock protein operon transcriptional activator [Pseudaeromonas paramecii]|uniref:Phage shock protein operon transcriptional activator n=1 Tax=Pseudaeromonas paramecii TaxID=2138166 RepID=A0ABP8PTS5_9GAMM